VALLVFKNRSIKLRIFMLILSYIITLNAFSVNDKSESELRVYSAVFHYVLSAATLE